MTVPTPEPPWIPEEPRSEELWSEELWSVIEFLHSAEGRELGDLVLRASRGRPARGLPAAVRLNALAQQWLVDQVSAARRDRWSWAQIGRVTGTSKQTVYRRYAHRLDEGDAHDEVTEAERARAELLAWATGPPSDPPTSPGLQVS